MTKIKTEKKPAHKLTGQGGAGRGQGRKFKYGEPTELVRIPISLIPEVEELIRKKYPKPPEDHK